MQPKMQLPWMQEVPAHEPFWHIWQNGGGVGQSMSTWHGSVIGRGQTI
jgi:hypothetical protein